VKAGRPLAFIVLAFIVGATISQASFAFADDSATNPFRAVWDAIAELQVKTDSLQSQIDDLREQRGASPAAGADGTAAAAAARIADPSIAIEAASGSQTLVHVIGRNSGPENAVGVKLTLYYQTSLFTVDSIQGAAGCTDGSRGIIECYLGTIDAGSEARITIAATPFALGQQAIFSADISSITEDANPANNHAEAAFITSDAPAAVPQEQAPSPSSSSPAQQPEVQQEEQEEQQPPADSQQVEVEEGEQPADQQPAEGQQGEEQAAPVEEQEQQEQQPGEGEEEQQQQPSEQPAPQGEEEQPADGSGSSQPPEEQGTGEGSQQAGGSGEQGAAG
jgi:hypothetical protein